MLNMLACEVFFCCLFDRREGSLRAARDAWGLYMSSKLCMKGIRALKVCMKDTCVLKVCMKDSCVLKVCMKGIRAHMICTESMRW